MEPYLQHGRSTLSPFIFARDGSIGPRRSRPICSSQFPPTSGGLMKRQTHHMEITRVAHIVLCYVPTHTNSMPLVLEMKRSRINFIVHQYCPMLALWVWEHRLMKSDIRVGPRGEGRKCQRNLFNIVCE